MPCTRYGRFRDMATNPTPRKVVAAPTLGTGEGVQLLHIIPAWIGTGAALKDASIAGTGSMIGTLGGMGGVMQVGGFGGRSGSTRQKMLQEGGGNSISEAAVARGIEWLALHQAPDGHWSLNEFNRH